MADVLCGKMTLVVLVVLFIISLTTVDAQLDGDGELPTAEKLTDVGQPLLLNDDAPDVEPIDTRTCELSRIYKTEEFESLK